MTTNIKFLSGISKYGYRMCGIRHMLYIEFFDHSVGGNSPTEQCDEYKNIDNTNIKFEAFHYKIIKIENIVTKKTIDRLYGYICNEYNHDSYINYYTTYKATIDNILELKMYKYLFPHGFAEYRKIFYCDGTLAEEYFHVNGKISGNKIEYDYSGSIVGIEEYVDGKLHGICKYFYFGTNIIYKELYCKNNLEYGKEKIFNKKGKLLYINYYKNGTYDGIIRKYCNIDGKLLKITNYKNGKKDGICISFDKLQKKNCVLQ
jgi:antitoxin component YwqK of YwqJK toxin-antitoxin module